MGRTASGQDAESFDPGAEGVDRPAAILDLSDQLDETRDSGKHEAKRPREPERYPESGRV